MKVWFQQTVALWLDYSYAKFKFSNKKFIGKVSLSATVTVQERQFSYFKARKSLYWCLQHQNLSRVGFVKAGRNTAFMLCTKLLQELVSSDAKRMDIKVNSAIKQVKITLCCKVFQMIHKNLRHSKKTSTAQETVLQIAMYVSLIWYAKGVSNDFF